MKFTHFLSCLCKAPTIVANPPEVVNQTSADLSCNLTGSTLPIKGSRWMHNGKTIENSETNDPAPFTLLR